MSSLLGVWLFTQIIYQGQLMDRPNQNLKLYYIFNSEVQNEIYYYRDNENGYCKRLANYNIISEKNLYIEQTVIETDAQNNSECALDTDMQIGNYSKTQFEIKNEKLYLYLPLGEDKIVYIFEQQMK
ncbi:MAG: hypothetical protein ACK41T_10400 [Pseudobdellovibrio sp.]